MNPFRVMVLCLMSSLALAEGTQPNSQPDQATTQDTFPVKRTVRVTGGCALEERALIEMGKFIAAKDPTTLLPRYRLDRNFVQCPLDMADAGAGQTTDNILSIHGIVTTYVASVSITDSPDGKSVSVTTSESFNGDRIVRVGAECRKEVVVSDLVPYPTGSFSLSLPDTSTDSRPVDCPAWGGASS